MYFTYVLKCESNKGKIYYVGFTKNLKLRFKRHLNKEVSTTKKFDKIILIYYEACLNKTDVRKREIQLKTGFGRGYLKRRLESYLRV
jgi:putative endonuclease